MTLSRTYITKDRKIPRDYWKRRDPDFHEPWSVPGESKIIHGFDVGSKTSWCGYTLSEKMKAAAPSYILEAGSLDNCLFPGESWCKYCIKTPEWGMVILALL